jgi:hypothetical protein
VCPCSSTPIRCSYIVEMAASEQQAILQKDPKKQPAIDMDLDEIADEISQPNKRKRKGPAKGKGKRTAHQKVGKSSSQKESLPKSSCEEISKQEQDAERLHRIEAIRKKARDAFATEVEDDDDEIECIDLPSAPVPIRASSLT